MSQCIVNQWGKNPQNCPFALGFRHPIREGTTAIGNMHKTGKDRACGSGDMPADRQTDRQTHAHTDVLMTILRRAITVTHAKSEHHLD